MTKRDATMDILLLLIPISVLIALAIGAILWWAVASGQFDDLDGPAHRILADDDACETGTTTMGREPAHESPPGALTSINAASGKDR